MFLSDIDSLRFFFNFFSLFLKLLTRLRFILLPLMNLIFLQITQDCQPTLLLADFILVNLFFLSILNCVNLTKKI